MDELVSWAFGDERVCFWADRAGATARASGKGSTVMDRIPIGYQMAKDYCLPGAIVSIGKHGGDWRRQPDDVRYRYRDARTQCPVCHADAAGYPWGGWFTCELRGCCVALVDTGEVFIRVLSDTKSDTKDFSGTGDDR